MIRLARIGHVALRVADIERSRKFYSTLLGFEVVEEDPEHGGVFMALEGLSHTIDLFPIPDGQAVPAPIPGAVGVRHVAFLVDSEPALKDAYLTLQANGVPIVRNASATRGAAGSCASAGSQSYAINAGPSWLRCTRTMFTAAFQAMCPRSTGP